MSIIITPNIENFTNISDIKECNCCMENINIKDIITCSKNHNICKSCMIKTNRDDCFICNPLEKNNKSEDRHIILSLDCFIIFVKLLFSIIMSNIIVACCFLSFTYIGKVYIYIYFKINSTADNSWFGWDKFNYILGETILGFFGSLIIGSFIINIVNYLIKFF